MQLEHPDWQQVESLKLRLKIHHFNESVRRYRVTAKPVRPMTWAQAFQKQMRNLPILAPAEGN